MRTVEALLDFVKAKSAETARTFVVCHASRKGGSCRRQHDVRWAVDWMVVAEDCPATGLLLADPRLWYGVGHFSLLGINMVEVPLERSAVQPNLILDDFKIIFNFRRIFKLSLINLMNFVNLFLQLVFDRVTFRDVADVQVSSRWLKFQEPETKIQDFGSYSIRRKTFEFVRFGRQHLILHAVCDKIFSSTCSTSQEPTPLRSVFDS